ncbi:MAG TPA: non-canonical purine NTP pyrophosphatase, partial [bacterium]|nr:non-canonical purine NTP pyrophosphatase [bacterium]
MDLTVASRNTGKITELKKLLSGLPFRVFSLDDFKNVPEVEEDGETYEENAAKKALAVAAAAGMPALAEDSGLEVDALLGKPGVRSARFGGEGLSDHERYMKLLGLLEETADEDRGAQFRCTIAIAVPGKILKTVQGVCRGTIIREPRGGGGFGYDPVFIPVGYNHTFAELSP